MGNALVLQSGLVLNPGGTITALTANAGETFTVPAFTPGSDAFLFSPFSPGASAGVFRIRSPRLHDAAQGIRMERGAAAFEPLLPVAALQPIYPADVLTVEASGGGAETDLGAFLEWFEDLPGIASRLHTWADIAPHVRNIAGVEVALTAGATAGQYGTQRALNFSFDTLKASVDYAVLGYVCSVKVAVVCIFGPDTGNQHVGGPGSLVEVESRQWFKKISDESGLPCIPVINANNRGSTFVQIADVAAATASNVALILAELSA